MAVVIPVNDLTHPGLSDYVSLTDVALRKVLEPENGLYIAESPKVIARALNAGHEPRSLLIKKEWLSDIEPLVEPYSCPIYVGDDELLERLTGFHMHRGALASMHRPTLLSPEELIRNSRTIVVLEDIVDHTNVGAIFRSVAGLGADAVLITPRCADPFYRRSVRVSMGTVFQIPWTRMKTWDSAAELLSRGGFHIAAMALDERAISLDEFLDFGYGKVAYLFGAEGDGLTLQAINHADSIVTIPMQHGVDSLNVASSSAVVLYAHMRHQ